MSRKSKTTTRVAAQLVYALKRKARNTTRLLELALAVGSGEQGEEMDRLMKADEHSTAIIVGGPLVNPDLAGDPTDERLESSIDELSGTTAPDYEVVGNEMGNVIQVRTEWAYRIGVTVGLRLVRVLDERR